MKKGFIITLLSEKIDTNRLAPAITRTLQKYSNYQFIAKVENENSQLKQIINKKDVAIDEKDKHINTINQEKISLIEKIKSFANEKNKITDTVSSIKQTISEYTTKIKEQAQKLDIYESIFKKHNIDIGKELDLNKEKSPKIFSMDR